MTQELKAAISAAIEEMGMLGGGSKLEPGQARAWSKAVGERLTSEEVRVAADYFVQNANFFPKPHEFISQAESMRPAPKALRGWDIWGNTSGDWSNCDPDEAQRIFEYCWNAHNCSVAGREMPARTEAMLKRMGAYAQQGALA